jgi:azurin
VFFLEDMVDITVTTRMSHVRPLRRTSRGNSSSSSEELLPDDPGGGPSDNESADDGEPQDSFIAVEPNINEKDLKFFAKGYKKRRHGEVWLSKKLAEKGGEVTWSHLTLDQKKEYKKRGPKTVMGMRWVLTRKADQTAKARLVVLGFQAHNLCEVETSSPTMSKLGRNCVLAIAAAMGFIVKSGDVTSAFLQTGISLEDENLHVLAPPELSAIFGAQHGEQLVLKVREAFYGWAPAPRKWFEKCVNTMPKLNWKQLKGDRYIFALYETERTATRSWLALQVSMWTTTSLLAVLHQSCSRTWRRSSTTPSGGVNGKTVHLGLQGAW